MALEYFGWFVPKVASGPKPHPEEAVGSHTQILHSHLRHCHLFQAGLQLQPTLLALQLQLLPPLETWPHPSWHMINPKCLAGLEGPTQGTGNSSAHPRAQGSVGPSACTWL